MNKIDRGRKARMKLKEGAAERAAINEQREREEATKKLPPMIPLGYLKDGKTVRYYVPVRHCSIDLKPNEHRADYFLQQANLMDWAAWLFPDENEKWAEEHEAKIWKAAKARLFEEARKVGREDPERLRKIGMWEEEVDGVRGILYNAGNACFFVAEGGERPQKVDNMQERHIYSSETPMPAPADTPLTDQEGRELVAFFEERPWEMKAGAGVLLVGWIVNSTLAGVMKRRPHLWITAPAATGKSYLHDDVMSVFGFEKDRTEGLCLTMEGAATSAAGARQKIASCARPVVFDELEGNGDQTARKNIADVLALMRTAYSSQTGIFTKGGEDGTAKDYMVRCGFLNFSVHSQLEQDTDRTRCLELRMQPLPDAEKEELWKRQKKGREMVKREGFAGQLLCRLMQQATAIEENVENLTAYLNQELKDARRAELMAHLLAGSYAVAHGGKMRAADMAQAAEVARAYAETEEQTSEFDECLNHLLDWAVHFMGGDRNVRQLCRMVRDENDSGNVSEAVQALEANGMRWRNKKDELEVRPYNAQLKKVYSGTRWMNKIKPVLTAGCKGSKPNSRGVHISSAANGKKRDKAIFIPAALVFPGEEADDEE